MGIQQADTMSRLVDAATRLREVRQAKRRFLELWAVEQSDSGHDDPCAGRSRGEIPQAPGREDYWPHNRLHLDHETDPDD